MTDQIGILHAFRKVLPCVSILVGSLFFPCDFARATERDASPSHPRSYGSAETEPAPRRPADLALAADQQRLFVANGRGTLSVVDLTTEQAVREYPLGKQLAALAWLNDQQLLAVDQQEHELIQLMIAGDEVTVQKRIPVSPYPVGVITTEGNTCYVTSLWSRRITELSLGERGILEVSRVLDLPIAPRCLLVTPDAEQLIIADSFSGRLALVARDTFQLRAVRTFPGHNFRGLAASNNGRMLVIAHQMLNDLAHTVRNDVHWGLLMSNDLRWLRFESLLDPEADLYEGAHMHPLGGASNAAADPSGIAIAANGTVVVTLGGVNEVALGRETDFSLYRIPVGKRPTAVVTSADSERAYIANTFDDTISVVDLAGREVISHISLGGSRPLTLVERGEELFYSGRLSHDGWMSCHSCHTDGHTNGGLNDNFSDNSFGASKRVLSLLGVAGTAPFAWNGQVEDLETQIQNSVIHTMQGSKRLSEPKMAAMVAYLESLSPPPSLDRLRGTLDVAAVARGKGLFGQLGCAECHAPPWYTTPAAYDVGLEDSEGNRHYNPPSLRGLSQRGPYFHDNRAADLESVFREHHHPEKHQLSDDEFSDLLAFLGSL
jgi:YVTN family beta-propeller protein